MSFIIDLLFITIAYHASNLVCRV